MLRRSRATVLLLTMVAPASATLWGSRPDSSAVVLRQGLSGVTRAAAVSADGRFVAFVSSARLAPEDLNDFNDVYVFDREEVAVTLETVAFNGGASNGSSESPDLSADGRHLVFESRASNLTPAPDTNQGADVFIRDRISGSTRRVSAGVDGQEANGDSRDPVISADARAVAFDSTATNLVAGGDANGSSSDVYLARLDTGVIQRISVDDEGRQTLGVSFGPALSADAGVVAFTSTRFDPRAAPPSKDQRSAVFVRDQASGVTTCLSCGSGARAFQPSVTADGAVVVFVQDTAKVRPRTRTHIVLVDRVLSTRSVLTRRGNGNSARPKISATGRFIVFESLASNLECDRRCRPCRADDNLLSDIYLFDRTTRAFTRISGQPRSWWAPSVGASIDAEGRVIVFTSRQPVGPEDMTTDEDLFIWPRASSHVAAPQ